MVGGARAGDVPGAVGIAYVYGRHPYLPLPVALCVRRWLNQLPAKELFRHARDETSGRMRVMDRRGDGGMGLVAEELIDAHHFALPKKFLVGYVINRTYHARAHAQIICLAWYWTFSKPVLGNMRMVLDTLRLSSIRSPPRCPRCHCHRLGGQH